MDQQEELKFFSPLAVLPRLDRLDRLLQFLEEKHSSSGVRNESKDQRECKSLSSALEEVHHKGTLIERLELLEKRVSQLSVEMDINSSRSSFSGIEAPEKLVRKEVEDGQKENVESVEAKEVEKNFNSEVSRKGKKHRRWLRWLGSTTCAK